MMKEIDATGGTVVFDWRGSIRLLGEPLFSLGQTPVSILTIVQFLVLLVGVAFAARMVRKVFRRQMGSWTSLDAGLQESLARAAGHVVLFVGFFVALQILGVDLTSLAVLAGALGLGIGFGLQNIVNNFVSGLIILAERPIQLGDRVVVGDVEADVIRIGARSTSIRTNDNIVIIVPNSEFISGRVTNLSHGDPKIRIRIPFGVGYDSDVRLVERLAVEAAKSSPDTLESPPPKVRFTGFGDSALEFELRAWTVTLAHRPGAFRSDLYFALWDTFKDHGVNVPFPQRDLHFKDGVRLHPPG